MFKKKLFENESEDEIELKTENEYAKKYDSWREKEEIHKLEQKYGPDALKSDGVESSDSEDESDEGPEVSEEVEEQFLKTLALLKSKDPRIYDPNFKGFELEEEKKSEEKSKPKPLTFDDSDEDDDDGDIFKIEKKAEIDEDDTQKDTSSEVSKQKKEKKIKEYLTGKAENVDEEVERDLAPLKALWSDPKLNEGEAFLRDYILNKRYLEDGDVGEAAERLRDDVELEADEQTVEEQSKFERAYNFRFEEPDDEYLKRFPRTMSSIRPKDDKRSRKRAELRARKEDDKRRKMEEIGRLKALKLKEIQEKIAKIKEVTGNDELAFKEEDIEGDFDPEEHDRRMKALFDEEFYGEADNEKPVFPDLDEELEIENWDKYDVDAEHPEQSRSNDEPHCEDDDFNMDADFDPKQPRANLLQEIQKTLGKKRRNRKRKSKLAEILTTEKPKFVPDAQKTYDEYMEEYYKMDCEDIVGGDLPTRFKYREVVPNDFGLTIEEILLADDKELTQWVPLKRIVKHRPQHLERGDVTTYAQRAADQRLKKKVLPSLFRDLPEEPELLVPVEDGTKKKKKKKNKTKKQKVSEDVDTTEDNGIMVREHSDSEAVEENNEIEMQSEVKQKKKRNNNVENKNATESQNQPGQKEIQPDIKQKKNKKRKSNNASNFEQNLVNSNETTSQENKPSSFTEVSSKKRTSESENNSVSKEDDNVAIKEIVTPAVKNKKKKKKQKQVKLNGDNNPVNSKINENAIENNKLQKTNAFVVQKVSTQGPSQKSNNNNKTNPNKNGPSPGKGVKRKLEPHVDSTQQKKKKQEFNSKGKKDMKPKFNQKDKFKKKNKFNSKKNDDNANPLSKLSDERLKAYGLNPKKYKNFLKYKKF